jgi:hypothetical protein
MPDLIRPQSIIGSLPDPPIIRERLSEIAEEADLLRALLHILQHRECGRRVLRRRRRAAAHQEVSLDH